MNEIQHTPKYDDLVYDVGMHKGEDTDYYIRKGFRVVGIEADPNLAELCRTRFAGQIRDGKLVLVEGAITESPSGETGQGKTKFYKNKNISVWGTVVNERANLYEQLGTSHEIIEVPVVNFSDCLKEYGIPHYLKIDIEGMDKACLKSLLHFQQRPDYISIESEKVFFNKLIEEIDLLAQLGYTGFKAIQQSGISHQIEPNPSNEGHYVGYRFIEGSSGLFGSDLPSEWKDYNQILDKYKFIFLQYNLFGDSGKLNRYYPGKVLRKGLSILLRKTIPGWYDTHARHSSVVA